MRSRSNVSSVEIEIRSASQLEVSRIDARGPVSEQPPDLTREHGPQLRVRQRRQSPERPDPRRREALLCPRADAGQDPGRKRREESRLATGRHDRDPTGLPPIRRHLADHLRRRDTERARERCRAAHRDLHRLGKLARARERVEYDPEVEVALVDPRPLDARHDLPDRRPDRLRVLAVERVPRAQEDRPPDIGGAPRRSSSPTGSRTCARRSSPSRPHHARAGRRRRRAGASASDGSSSSSTAAKNASRSRCARIGMTSARLRFGRDPLTATAATASRDRAARPVSGVLRRRRGTRLPGRTPRGRPGRRPRGRSVAPPRPRVRRRRRPAAAPRGRPRGERSTRRAAEPAATIRNVFGLPARRAPALRAPRLDERLQADVRRLAHAIAGRGGGLRREPHVRRRARPGTRERLFPPPRPSSSRSPSRR